MGLSEEKDQSTYENIRNYVQKTYGLKVSSLYVAQMKAECGLETQADRSDDKKQPKCPPEKREAILDAFRHFGLIGEDEGCCSDRNHAEERRSADAHEQGGVQERSGEDCLRDERVVSFQVVLRFHGVVRGSGGIPDGGHAAPVRGVRSGWSRWQVVGRV